jgi:two-component system KDP operon response regulator KdpE
MSDLAPAVLVVEDEKQIPPVPRLSSRWVVHEAATGRKGLVDAGTRADVVAGPRLPDIAGVDFIKNFRGWSTAPILVLSALGRGDRCRRSTPARTTIWPSRSASRGFGSRDVRAGRVSRMATPRPRSATFRSTSRAVVLRNGQPVHLP